MSESDAYKTFRPIGAMSHCAPEKWLLPHEVGPESDVFSLGVLVYHATTDTYPFWEDTYVKLYEKIKNGIYRPAPSLKPTLSRAFANLIDGMMNSSQLFRVPSADEVIRLAQGVLRGGD